MKNTAVFAILMLLTCISGRVTAQNLIQNGDLETGDLTSWNVGDPNTIFVDANPHSGNYAAWLGTFTGTSFLSQDLTTVAGQQYQISFFVANNYLQDPFLSGPSSLTVSFGNTILYNHNPVPYADYTQQTGIVTASGSTTTLLFTEQQQNGYLFLDDISVTALVVVPELSGTLSIGALLSLCGLVLRRRGLNAR